MKATFTIRGRFPSLNEYIDAERTVRYKAAAMKRKYTDLVADTAYDLPAFRGPVFVTFNWYERDKRRDPDNIRFAAKFILDGLVKAGVIKNDTQRWICGLEDRYHVDAQRPRVVVTLSTKKGEPESE